MTSSPTRLMRRIGAAILGCAALTLLPIPALAFELGIVAFQMSSETHARVANAAAAAAKAKGWTVTQLNSEGSLPKHAEQIDTLVNKKVDAIVVAMGKPVEAGAQYQNAKSQGIPIVAVMAGASPHFAYDIEVNEYKVGADSSLYLLGRLGFTGNILSVRFEGNAGTRVRGKVFDAVLSENTAVKEVGKFSMARTSSWRDDVRNGVQALLLRNQGKLDGVWVAFDGQAFIVDDLLRAQGRKKGELPIVSTDGGAETYRRIADPESLIVATVAIPFEAMGKAAVDGIESIVVKKQPKDAITKGPYLFMDATIVDANNVAGYTK